GRGGGPNAPSACIRLKCRRRGERSVPLCGQLSQYWTAPSDPEGGQGPHQHGGDDEDPPDLGADRVGQADLDRERDPRHEEDGPEREVDDREHPHRVNAITPPRAGLLGSKQKQAPPRRRLPSKENCRAIARRRIPAASIGACWSDSMVFCSAERS